MFSSTVCPQCLSQGNFCAACANRRFTLPCTLASELLFNLLNAMKSSETDYFAPFLDRTCLDFGNTFILSSRVSFIT
jgi:hypothetical protein